MTNDIAMTTSSKYYTSSSITTMLPLYKCEQNYEAQIRAQELNEHSAFCIEIAHYNRAIDALIEALQVTECTTLDVNYSCRCGSCNLDACMQYSQDYFKVVDDGGMQTKLCGSLSPVGSSSQSEGFIYRQPIRIPPEAVKGGHIMGMTLPLILTFNLALAYHLNAISVGRTTGATVNRAHLQKILQLYELSYRWQTEQEQTMSARFGHGDLTYSSIKFTMIIANNLGQIHYAVNNTTKYYLCLQHLLSTIMFLVDCQQLNAITPHRGQNNRHQRQPSMELDGFLRNTSCLFLQHQAAAAA